MEEEEGEGEEGREDEDDGEDETDEKKAAKKRIRMNEKAEAAVLAAPSIAAPFATGEGGREGGRKG